MVTRRCDTKLTEPGTACTLLPVAGRGSEAWVPGHWEVPASAAWSQSTRQITTCILAAGPTCFKTARKLTSEGLVQQDLPGPSKDSRAARGPLWSKLGPPGGGDDGSGGHGIPAELFQILKDEAVQSAALNMPANLETSAVATEKVSFHSNPKEGQCQRMFKLGP